MARNAHGMVLLNVGNRVLEQSVLFPLQEIQENPDKYSQQQLLVTLCDFDGVSYSIVVKPEEPTALLVSMAMPCFASIAENGAGDALGAEYKDFLCNPEPDMDVTLRIDATALGDQKLEDLAEHVSRVKSVSLGGVYRQMFSSVDGKTVDPFKFEYRPDTTVYFCPGDNRCVVIFSLDFEEKVDRAMAKIFFKEFKQAKRDRALGSAPPVDFTSDPPRELGSFGITEASGRESHVGYLSFAILPTHTRGEQFNKTVATLQTFRNYIQYHMKCAKSYFHMRMRAKCQDLLKVLNRAKMDQGEKKKKTISGKTFQRN